MPITLSARRRIQRRSHRKEQQKKKVAATLVLGNPGLLNKLLSSYPHYPRDVILAPLQDPLGGILANRQISHEHWIDSVMYWEYVFRLAADHLLEREAAETKIS